MKTLLFTSEFPPFKGGVANYYGQLANYWPINEKLLVLNNNKGELIKNSDFLPWWPAIGALKRKIGKNQIDYVLVGQLLPLGTVTWFLSWFYPFQYAVFLHGMDLSFALRSGRKKWLASLILKRADRIICANSYVAEKVEEFYQGGSKISVVNPGVPAGAPPVDAKDLMELDNTYNLAGKTVLFSLGRLVKRKGVDQTIKALEEITEPVIDNLIYFIGGAGPREEYLRRLVPDRLAKKIIFLGELSEKEKWLWLKRSDIFIMPARNIDGDFEGFGIVYLEANLSGKPVIAGNAGGIKDAVRDNYNGLLVDPENPVSIKEAIHKLALDKNLCEKLGQQGRQRAIQEFNWEKQTAKLVGVITTQNS